MPTKAFVLVVGVALLLCSRPAFGYIDPGTGSVLIQGLVAAFAAVGVAMKLYWHRLAALFGGQARTTEQAKESTDEATQSRRDNG